MKTKVILALCALPMLAGCGSSSSGQSSTPAASVVGSSTKTPTPIPGRATATLAVPPADTPTPGPPTLVVHPGDDVIAVIRSAPAGSVVAFASGTYASLRLQASDVQGPLSLVADVNGQLTDGSPLPVLIAAGTGAPAALVLSGISGLTIDGFTIEGGTDEALYVSSSPQTTVQNCIVRASDGDGIFVEAADQTVILDNIVVGNHRAGIRAYGASSLQAINNTVYGNHDNGVSVGNAQEPSANVTVVNNIVSANAPAGIVVDATTSGYDGNFNLNTDGYGPDTPSGPNDIDMNPLFVDPQGGDFHLADGSPAIDTGDSAIDADAVILLEQRGTRIDGSADNEPLDLGYQYPTPPPTPTPLPRNTRKKTATPTPTRVGG